jgi:GNAT superfamily N-acetyltransferase
LTTNNPEARVTVGRHLTDGTAVAIVRLLETDRAFVRDDLPGRFAELSDESRFLRFLSPVPRLSGAYLKVLADSIDDHDHVAITLQALGPHEREDTAGGRLVGLPIGIGRFIRDQAEPEEADVAVTVSDAWHGRGAGSLIVRELARLALQRGVRRFVAISHAQNPSVLRMLAHAGPVLARTREGTEVRTVITLRVDDP